MCDNRINCGCDDCYDDDSMFSECLPFEQVTTVINTTQFEKGQVLQKDTMEAMRSLSDEEINLLKEGHYSHVQLNGYYEAGDTPAAINYYLSDTADPDDGGSVVEVQDIKLEHIFLDVVDTAFFGVNEANNDNIFNLNSYINNLSSTIKTLKVNSNINLPKDFSIEINKDGLIIDGGGYLVDKSDLDSVSSVVVNASNVCIHNIELKDNFKTAPFPVIRHNKGDNLHLLNASVNSSVRAYQCFAEFDGNKEDVYGITIESCKFYDLKDGLYFGESTAVDRNGEIHNIKVLNNTFYSGRGNDEITGGDAIKTIKKCYNITISDNYISEFGRDGIDLFASGDKVIVSNNQIVSCRIKAIDIKSNLDEFIPSVWGNNGANIIISGNIINNNYIGISIARDSDLTTSFNHGISIVNNQFVNNGLYAIGASAKYITVSQNYFTGNGSQTEAANYGCCYFGDGTEVRSTQNSIISENIFVNNGRSSVNNYAILMQVYCNNNQIINNTIENDTSLFNPQQTHGIYLNSNTINKVLGNSVKVNTPYTLVSGAKVEDCYSVVSPVKITSEGYTFIRAMNGDGFVAIYRLTSSEALSVNATNYVILNLIRRRAGVDTTIASYNQSTTGMSALVPLSVNPSSAANRSLNDGDFLIARVFRVGTPTALNDISIQVDILDR